MVLSSLLILAVNNILELIKEHSTKVLVFNYQKFAVLFLSVVLFCSNYNS